MPNIYKPEFEDGDRPEGFGSKRARIGYEHGSETVRFQLGEEGAHQIFNTTEETVTLLALSSHGRPDIVVYPEADKVGIGERLPKGGGLRLFFKREDAVGYFAGEEFSPEQQ